MKLALIILVAFAISDFVYTPAYGQMSLPFSLPNQIDSFNINQPGVTFADIMSHINSSVDSTDTLENGIIEELKAFETIWASRVGINDSTSSDSTGNMFTQYMQRLSDAIAARAAGMCPASSNFTGNWHTVGPANLSRQSIGRVDAVWADPSDATGNTILAGTSGGLFKTIDGGSTWSEPITDNAPIANGITGITSIAVDVSSSPPYNHIVLGTSGISLLESTDGGSTWNQIAPDGNLYKYFQLVKFSPDGHYIYACSGTSIFVKDNTVSTNPWINITPDISIWPTGYYTLQNLTGIISAFNSIVFAPNDLNGRFFISTYTQSYGPAMSATIWEASYAVPNTITDWHCISPMNITITDVGAGQTLTFTNTSNTSNATNTNSFGLSISDESNKLYAIGVLGGPGWNAGLFEYPLSGSTPTWTAIPNTNDKVVPGGYAARASLLQLRVSPINHNNMYYASDIPYMSINGGNTWVQIGQYSGYPTHGDVRDMCFQKASTTSNGTDDLLYFANDGGISKKPPINVTTVADPSLLTLNVNGTGLTCGQFLGVATSEKNGLLAGGMFHDGVNLYNPAWYPNPQWKNFYSAGDSWDGIFDNADQKTAYLQEAYSVTSSWDVNLGSGITFQNISTEQYFRTQPWAKDLSNSIYTGQQRLWEKAPPVTNSTFSPISYGLPAPSANGYRRINTMAISPYLSNNANGPVGYVLYENDWSYASNGHGMYVGAGIYYRPTNSPSSTPFHQIHVVDPTNSNHNWDQDVPVNSITCDPLNPARVWLALGYNQVAKIMYSNDGGNTWYDVSAGLPSSPNMSATNIIYQEGSDDGTNESLFCSTDVGIYHCFFNKSNPTSSYWECFNTGFTGCHDFPNVAVTQLAINYCQQKLYASTIGRSIMVSDIYPSGYPFTSPPGELVINGTPPSWFAGPGNMITGDHYMATGIRLKPGTYLRIGNGVTPTTMHMPKNSRIVIEPGASLWVNGATLTNSCDTCMWQGIDVFGTTNQPQTTTPIPFYHALYQGYLYMKNSTLEHSRWGVVNCNGDDYTNQSGGIIQALNTHFLNNTRSAVFMRYPNVNGSVGTNDMSYFAKCHFELNNNYRGEQNGDIFDNHCQMWAVSGIYFKGCNFENTNNLTISSGLPGNNNGSGNGITSYGAQYYVTNLGTTPSSFTGFIHGIDAGGDLSLGRDVFVDHTNFDKNVIGIRSSFLNTLHASHNTFTIGDATREIYQVSKDQQTKCPSNIGIYTYGSNLYQIAANNFIGVSSTSPYAPDLKSFGTFNQQSDGFNNNILINNYKNLDFGAYSLGKNRGMWWTIPTTPGLRYLCNVFEKNTYDIFVQHNFYDSITTGYPLLWDGIADRQGEPYPIPGTYGANGNQFVDAMPNSGKFANYSNLNIQYYHYSGSPFTPYYIYNENPQIIYQLAAPYYFTKVPCVSASNCAKVAVNYGLYRYPSTELKNLLKSDFYTSEAHKRDSLTFYDSLIDGGNTGVFFNTIDTTNPGDSTSVANLYNLFIGYAPFISAQSILEAIRVKVFAHDQYMGVFNANPDAILNNALLQYAHDSIPLSDTDMLSLNNIAIKNAPTHKGHLEASIAGYQWEMDNTTTDIISLMGYALDTTFVNHQDDSTILVDTLFNPAPFDSVASTASDIDSIPVWLNKMNYTWAQYDIVKYYYSKDSFTLAQSTLDSIPYKFPLTDMEYAEYRDYQIIWPMLIAAKVDGREVYNLTDTEIDLLSTVATETPYTSPQIFANSLLGRVSSAKPTFQCKWGPPTSKKTSNNINTPKTPNVNDAKKLNSFLAAFPNPAKDNVTFRFNVPNSSGNMLLTVTDMVGQTIQQFPINNKSGQISWNIKELPAGVYVYKMTDQSNIVGIGKLVIQK